MVGRGSWVGPVLVLAGVMLAGCSEGGPPEATLEPAFTELGLEATATTGVIRGVVVDDAIRPVANAKVALASGTPQEAITTEDGLFGFDGLPAGSYFLKVSRPGYFDVQQSADVVAGVAEPPIVKVLLPMDAGYQAYVVAQVYDGWIECTTSFLVLCGAPNTLEPLFCAGAQQPPLPPAPPICWGNLTNDRFTWYMAYQPNMTLLQTELVWDSSQSLTPAMYIEAETLSPGCEDDDFYFRAEGASPVVLNMTQEDIEDSEILFSPECPVYYSLFSGHNEPLPRMPGTGWGVGATVQQRFQALSHSFYGFLPPVGWQFSRDGTPDPPV